ncbi:MAG: flagellar biosynthesis anti-sigma factor FlgM [bacterium]|nr:flagellar biosynthesis anti-sigma factor FlgM [bacterium]
MVIRPISEIANSLNPQNVAKREKVKGESVGRDKVDISSEGRILHQVQQASNIVSEAPDIRVEKVEEARERLTTSYYLQRQIVERIAERIAKALGF